MAFQIAKKPTAFAFSSGKKRPRKEDGKHLKAIRELPSPISLKGGCEAAHIRSGWPTIGKRETGLQEKPDDCWTLPLTSHEHNEQHAYGDELGWWKLHGFTPEMVLGLCEALTRLVRQDDMEAAVHVIQQHHDMAQANLKEWKTRLDGTTVPR